MIVSTASRTVFVAPTSGQSRNGYVIARWACMLAARDGYYVKPPEPLGKLHASPSPDDGLPW